MKFIVRPLIQLKWAMLVIFLSTHNIRGRYFDVGYIDFLIVILRWQLSSQHPLSTGAGLGGTEAHVLWLPLLTYHFFIQMMQL